MTRRQFNKLVDKTIEVVRCYIDKDGYAVSAEVKRLFRRKCIEIIFWHGCDDVLRNNLLSGRIKNYDLLGYPVVFDNQKGGGIVQSYTIMWTDYID